MSLQGAEVHSSEALPEEASGGLGTGETSVTFSPSLSLKSQTQKSRGEADALSRRPTGKLRRQRREGRGPCKPGVQGSSAGAACGPSLDAESRVVPPSIRQRPANIWLGFLMCCSAP